MVTLFNVTWLPRPKYIGWLEAVKGVLKSVFRRHCLKTIDLSNMRKGLWTVMPHLKKHIQCVPMLQSHLVSKTSFQQKDQ